MKQRRSFTTIIPFRVEKSMSIPSETNSNLSIVASRLLKQCLTHHARGPAHIQDQSPVQDWDGLFDCDTLSTPIVEVNCPHTWVRMK